MTVISDTKYLTALLRQDVQRMVGEALYAKVFGPLTCAASHLPFVFNMKIKKEKEKDRDRERDRERRKDRSNNNKKENKKENKKGCDVTSVGSTCVQAHVGELNNKCVVHVVVPSFEKDCHNDISVATSLIKKCVLCVLDVCAHINITSVAMGPLASPPSPTVPTVVPPRAVAEGMAAALVEYISTTTATATVTDISLVVRESYLLYEYAIESAVLASGCHGYFNVCSLSDTPPAPAPASASAVGTVGATSQSQQSPMPVIEITPSDDMVFEYQDKDKWIELRRDYNSKACKAFKKYPLINTIEIGMCACVLVCQ